MSHCSVVAWPLAGNARVQIFALCESKDIPATFFEITTALAFQHFRDSDVDAVSATLRRGEVNKVNHESLVEICCMYCRHVIADGYDHPARGSHRGAQSVRLYSVVPFAVRRQLFIASLRSIVSFVGRLPCLEEEMFLSRRVFAYWVTDQVLSGSSVHVNHK